MRFIRKYDPVDYNRQNIARQRMTNYLRAGGFRKIDGGPLIGFSIERNRALMLLVLLTIGGIGFYYAFMG